MLARQFAPEEVFANNGDLKSNGGLYPALVDYIGPQIFRFFWTRLWVGHVPYAVCNAHSNMFVSLTFLREPVSRLISLIRHLRKNQSASDPDDIWRLISKYRSGQLLNKQCRIFADRGVANLDYYTGVKPLDELGLQQAKENLAECALIDLTERFADSMYLAEKVLGRDLGEELRANTYNDKDGLLFSDDVLDEIRKMVEYDMQLYEFAKIEFEERLVRVKAAAH